MQYIKTTNIISFKSINVIYKNYKYGIILFIIYYIKMSYNISISHFPHSVESNVFAPDILLCIILHYYVFYEKFGFSINICICDNLYIVHLYSLMVLIVSQVRYGTQECLRYKTLYAVQYSGCVAIPRVLCNPVLVLLMEDLRRVSYSDLNLKKNCKNLVVDYL